MRIFFLIFLFSTSLLSACPFANGTYKKKPKNKLNYSSALVKRELNFEDLATSALFSNCSEFENKDYFSPENLNLLEHRCFIQNESLASVFKSLRNLYERKGGYKAYCQYLKVLRNKCSLLNNSEEVDLSNKSALYALCRTHFENNWQENCNDVVFFKEIIKAYPKPKKYNQLSIEELDRYFSESLSLNACEQWMRKIKRYLSRVLLKEWDSALVSFRFCWGHLQHFGKKVKVLRMGCPILMQNNKLKMDPLFLTYLKDLKTRNKKHLYINLMNRNCRGWENKASQLLIETQNIEGIEGFFYCICFPYNGDFYKQESLTTRYTEEFLQEFKTLLFSNKQGFYIPPCLSQNSEYQEEVGSIFRKIHSEFFNNKSSLSQRERWQFIDLAYAYLSDYFINQLSVDSVNWTCRHGIDRAMSAYTVFEGLHKKEEKEDLTSSIYYAYLPSFLFYSRAMVPYHSMRMLAALEKVQEITGNLSK